MNEVLNYNDIRDILLRYCVPKEIVIYKENDKVQNAEVDRCISNLAWAIHQANKGD